MIRAFSMLHNRMLADLAFLFKVGTEVAAIEVRKRVNDFWAEFELYAADLLVGVAVDIALVGLLAPYVRFGKPSSSTGLFGRFNRMDVSLPSSTSTDLVMKLLKVTAEIQRIIYFIALPLQANVLKTAYRCYFRDYNINLEEIHDLFMHMHTASRWQLIEASSDALVSDMVVLAKDKGSCL